jgi:hypothetical protein
VALKLSEKELINLMKNMKHNFPNEFYETIGFMKGLKVRMENERELSKLYDEYEIKNQ